METRDADAAVPTTFDAFTSRMSLTSLIPFVGMAAIAVYATLSLTANRSGLQETARQIAYLAPFFAASGASVFARAKSQGRERIVWTALMVGIGLITFSEGYVSLLLLLGVKLSSTLPELPAAASFVAAIAMLATLFGLADFRSMSKTVRLRHVLDGVTFSLLLFGAVLALVVTPLASTYGNGDAAVMLAAAAFSVIGVLLVIAASVNYAGRSWKHLRICERQVVFGIGVYGFATALWPAWYLGAVLHPASWLDIVIEALWMAGMLLVFCGAVTRTLVDDAAPRFRPIPRMLPRGRHWISVYLPASFVLAIPVFGFMAMAGARDTAVPGAYAFVSLGLAGALTVRSIYSAAENVDLNDRATSDPLTGLYGHRYFHERLQLELELAARHDESLSIAVVDLDDFSRVNSAFGHSHGDEVLRGAARAIAGVCRAGDFVCRLGADKFAIIFPGSSVGETERTGSRVLKAIAELECSETRITASVGIAGFPVDALDREGLFRRADGALYWAKYHSKNRVVVFDDSVVESLSAQERIERLEEQSHLATVQALAAAVDARDPLTQFHSRNVAVLAVMLAEELRVEPGTIRLIEIAALLHDIGKIGISDRVLRKRGSLTPAEERHIKEHSVLGEKILASTQLTEVLPWVRHHHERWDGDGYPDGLKADRIPLEARLLCICDAYDAMTSGRPYREALSSSAALQELDLCMGTQFDPALTEAFIGLVGRRKLLRPETRFEREGNPLRPAN